MTLTKAELEARVAELEQQLADAGDNQGGGGPVTLDDLTAEDRARLLEEASASLPAPPAHGGPSQIDDDEDAAREAQQRLNDRMDPRDHLRDCPAVEGDAPLNLEAIGRRAPAKGDEPAHDVTVIRCITCGGQALVAKSIDAIVG